MVKRLEIDFDYAVDPTGKLFMAPQVRSVNSDDTSMIQLYNTFRDACSMPSSSAYLICERIQDVSYVRIDLLHTTRLFCAAARPSPKTL